MGRKHWVKEKLLITSSFSLSRNVLKSLVLQTCKNQGLFGKGVKIQIALIFYHNFYDYTCTDLLFTTQSQLLMTLYQKPPENIVGNEENAGNQHFLLFPQCFQPFSKKNQIFSHIYLVVFKSFQFGLVTNFVVW